MRIGYLINDLAGLEPDQTTTLFIHGCAARGHDVWVFDVTQLTAAPSGEVAVRAPRLAEAGELLEVPATLRGSTFEALTLDSLDLLVLRTNPGRDKARSWAHDAALELLLLLQKRGVTVVNDPLGARICGSKMFLHGLAPELRPRTLVSCQAKALEGFVRSADGPTVLKPVQGSWGADVFCVEAADRNLKAIIEILCRGGYVVAQEFLPAVKGGDTRLLLLNGEPLAVDGCVAAVRRVPPAGEFRSNIHLGGTPTMVPALTPELKRVADGVGPELAARGILLAGLDVVGDRLLEVNAWSPGGITDAGRFQGVDFASAVLDAFEQAVA